MAYILKISSLMTIADCTAPFALEVRFDAAADANSATINNRGEPFVFKIDW